MIRKSPLLFFLIYSCLLLGQREGDQWVIGYFGDGVTPEYGIMHIDFYQGQPAFRLFLNHEYFINGTQGNICNNLGLPILITNGMEVLSWDGTRVIEKIAYDSESSSYWNYWYEDDFDVVQGFPQPNGALILPVPNREDEYSIICHNAEIHPPGYWQASRYLESRVHLNKDSTFNILYIDKLALPRHKWFTGTISAVRHANGRDWWVIVFEENSPRYYSMLLTEDGINVHHEGKVDSIVLEGIGQAVFSSQGNFMARMDAITLEEDGQFITLYSFDRCEGTLERISTFQEDGGFFTGVAFSPSERFLYADNNLKLWQWDLLADDIAASQVLVDTFDGFISPGWFGTYFAPMVNAPDGRIYIIPNSGGSKYFHVIDRPDLPAPDCRFLQHHIELPAWNGRTAPNIPNFRLGPLDDTVCDTLNLDNHPVAWWRYEPDVDFYWQTIRFVDLSFFNPETWQWDFGDGFTSEEPSPVNTFSPGFYEVCLTVSNSFSSDTMCQWIEILTTEVKQVVDQLPDLSVNPNPFKDELIIQSRSGNQRLVDLSLYDVHGKLVFKGAETPVPITINMPSLIPGIYYCSIKERDGEQYGWKLVKM
ncbi:MAG: T9SS type A sorting domain-containing protein [Saprospiraceae bacterium]|nr:T9SS type A sorting domain-containing protein [Saprospiraceae bacterium]